MVSGLSLSSISLKKNIKKKEAKTINIDDLPADNFSEKILIGFWKAYAKEKIKKGENNIAAVLQMNVPKRGDHFIIHFEVVNQLNKVELIREMEYFLPFLKEKLNNYRITLEINISKAVKIETAYTPKEKYELLVKINPELDTLRKSFDLEF